MNTLPSYRLFFFDMSGINVAIPLIARRIEELFPCRDHGRPITVGTRQLVNTDLFPIKKLLDKIKDEMGEKPVTIFDPADWLQSWYPRLAHGTMRNMIAHEQHMIRSQITFVFVPHDLFPELQEILGGKTGDRPYPLVEIAGVFLSGAFSPREVIYHQPL